MWWSRGERSLTRCRNTLLEKSVKEWKKKKRKVSWPLPWKFKWIELIELTNKGLQQMLHTAFRASENVRFQHRTLPGQCKADLSEGSERMHAAARFPPPNVFSQGESIAFPSPPSICLYPACHRPFTWWTNRQCSTYVCIECILCLFVWWSQLNHYHNHYQCRYCDVTATSGHWRMENPHALPPTRIQLEQSCFLDCFNM